jgi:MIF4G like
MTHYFVHCTTITTVATAANTAPSEDVEAAPGDWQVSVITHAMLEAGQLTPMALAQSIRRYRPLLRTAVDKYDNSVNSSSSSNSSSVAAASPGQAAVLVAAGRAWPHNSQQYLTAVRLLLAEGAVSPAAGVAHFFKQESSDVWATSTTLWHVLRLSLQSQLDAVKAAAVALSTARSNMQRSRSSSASSASSADADDAMDSDGSAAGAGADSAAAQSLQAAVRDMHALARSTVAAFTAALESALAQYADAGVTDPASDAWWVTATSHFKAAVRMLLSAPPVPPSLAAAAMGKKRFTSTVAAVPAGVFSRPEQCSEPVAVLLQCAEVAAAGA